MSSQQDYLANLNQYDQKLDSWNLEGGQKLSSLLPTQSLEKEITNMLGEVSIPMGIHGLIGASKNYITKFGDKVLGPRGVEGLTEDLKSSASKALSGDIKGAINDVGARVGSMADNMRSTVSDLGSSLTDFGNTVSGTIGRVTSRVGDAGKDLVNSASNFSDTIGSRIAEASSDRSFASRIPQPEGMLSEIPSRDMPSSISVPDISTLSERLRLTRPAVETGGLQGDSTIARAIRERPGDIEMQDMPRSLPGEGQETTATDVATETAAETTPATDAAEGAGEALGDVAGEAAGIGTAEAIEATAEAIPGLDLIAPLAMIATPIIAEILEPHKHPVTVPQPLPPAIAEQKSIET